MSNKLNKSIIQKIVRIIILTVVLVIGIVSVPEGSELQLFLFFLTGAILEYSQKIRQTKVEVIFNYLLIVSFFSVWLFIVPNKIHGVLFMLGIYFTKFFQFEMNQVERKAEKNESL